MRPPSNGVKGLYFSILSKGLAFSILSKECLGNNQLLITYSKPKYGWFKLNSDSAFNMPDGYGRI